MQPHLDCLFSTYTEKGRQTWFDVVICKFHLNRFFSPMEKIGSFDCSLIIYLKVDKFHVLIRQTKMNCPMSVSFRQNGYLSLIQDFLATHLAFSQLAARGFRTYLFKYALCAKMFSANFLLALYGSITPKRSRRNDKPPCPYV